MQKGDGTTVLTAFNQEAWNRSGISWLASLHELAKYDGDVCIVNDGLNHRTVHFLESNDVRLIDARHKFKDPDLDHFCTAMTAVTDVSAYWHNTSYFQSDLDELIKIAANECVFALRCPPQPTLRNSLEAFGYHDSDCQQPSSLYRTLLDTARSNGTVLQGQFAAGNKDRLSFLGDFIEFHVEHGYLNDSKHAVDLGINLFYASSPASVIVDSRWSELVDFRWTWHDKFFKGDEAIKVVSFQPESVFSAICARFHFVNSYRDLYASWHTKYRSQLAMPRLLLKQVKSKEPDYDQKQKIQIRQGE